jgi:hypothetical protein
MRLAVWLIVAVYALMACGSLLEGTCCQHESDHDRAAHEAPRHVHSKVQVTAHAFTHIPLLEAGSFLASRHCCCVSQGEHERGLQPHALTRQAFTPRVSDCSSKTIAPEELLTNTNHARGGSPYLLVNLRSMFILQSLHATILLI